MSDGCVISLPSLSQQVSSDMYASQVMLFSKAPGNPGAKTRLRERGDLAVDVVQALHAAMVNDSVELLRCSAAPDKYVFWMGSQDLPEQGDLHYRFQSGDSFGERLQGALLRLQEESSEPQGVVVIGSDCPYLSPGLMSLALSGISAGKLVVGPALEGGYYLFGVPARAVGRDVSGTFGSGAEVLELLRCFADCELELLPLLPDVDVMSDLGTLVAAAHLLEAVDDRGDKLYIGPRVRELAVAMQLEGSAESTRGKRVTAGGLAI